MTLRYKIYVICREFFQVALVIYVLLIVAETVFMGSVSNFFNLNILLIVLLVSGIVMALTERKGERYSLKIKD